MSCACFVLCTLNIYACDVCGSAVNAGYFGILPQFGNHFIGVRYLQSSFSSQELPSLFPVKHAQYSESFHRAEVYGRYFLGRRIMLFGFLPYQYNTQVKASGTLVSAGLSDITLQANYLFVNTGDSGRLNWRNTLSAGAGLKLPTGRYSSDKAASQQTGTGTLDYLLNLIYTTRYKKAGVNIDASMRLNTAGDSYRYGNRYAAGARFFYWHNYRKLSLLPQAGIMAEHAQKDLREHVIQRYTGGQGLYALAGADVYYGRCSFGFSYTRPLSETMNEDYSRTRHRVTVQALYLF